jgi:hypothetical protein
MEKRDPLELLSECLSIIEQTPDDKEAERILLFAFGLLQMADEEFQDRECGGTQVR